MKRLDAAQKFAVFVLSQTHPPNAWLAADQSESRKLFQLFVNDMELRLKFQFRLSQSIVACAVARQLCYQSVDSTAKPMKMKQNKPSVHSFAG